MIEKNIIELNKIYDIYKKYLYTKIEKLIEDKFSEEKKLSYDKIKQKYKTKKGGFTRSFKNFITLEEITKFLNDIVHEDNDLDNYKSLNSKFYNLSLDIIKEKIVRLLIFVMFGIEKPLLDDDISNTFNLILMFLTENLSQLFNAKNGYMLIIRESTEKVVAWYNENKSDLLDNIKVLEAKGRNELSKMEYFVTDDIKIEFLLETDHIDDKYSKCALKYISDFIKKNELKLNSLNSLKSRKIYSKQLYLDYSSYFESENIKFNCNKNSDIVKILHLSDLHIGGEGEFIIEGNEKKEYDYAKDFLEKFYSTEKGKNSDIDFIVITGDVAQAGNSTKQSLDNYKKSLRVLEVISKSILGNCWKERLIIIPGNHDYGMINELKLNFKDRSYNYAETNLDELTEFERFSFFHLIFDGILLENGFDIFKDNTQKVIKYELKNNKTINFYCFNTASMANAVRSNKVYFELDEKILVSKTHGNINVVLMHHTPLFEINYYRDVNIKYWENGNLLFGWTAEEVEMITKYKENQEEIGKKIKTKNNKIDIIIEEIKKEKEEKIKKILNDNNITEKKVENFIKDMEKDTSQDIKNLSKIKEKNIILEKYFCQKEIIDDTKKDEQVRKLSFFKTSRDDSNKYNDNIKKIEKIFSDFIILGGHQHEYNYKHKNNYDIFEMGKTFNKGEINYGVLKVNINIKGYDKWYFYTCLKKENK